jgi:transcriptional regulator with XRE-family HTH domain
MLTASQIRSARHALNWSVNELSANSGVSPSTIKRIESSKGVPNSNIPTVAALRASLESAGIEFIGAPDDDPGIRILTNRGDR